MNITKTIELTEIDLKQAITNYMICNGLKLPKELILDLEFFNGAQEIDLAFSKLKVSWEDVK